MAGPVPPPPDTAPRPTEMEFEDALDDIHDWDQVVHDVLTRELLHLSAEVQRLRKIEHRAHRLRSRPLDPSSESMGARACARFVLGESS